jgi:hypothetical protein
MSDRLRAIANALDQLVAQAGARVYFELMSGGLVWSDEYPPPTESGPLFPQHHLREIWNHRSSLIKGEPAERFRETWETALKLFPHWPGFLPERRDPKWRDFLEQEEKRSENLFENLDQRWRNQESAGVAPGTPSAT